MQRRRFLSLSALAVPSSQQAQAQAPGVVLTEVVTAMGSFVVAVDPARAPLTVANYLSYVDHRWLDKGSVYRVVTRDNQAADVQYKIEVVQWGMNAPDEKAPPVPAIAHETTQLTGLKHLDGTVSMARNGPGTASSEFFICVGDQPELDFGGRRNPDGQGFAAFGQVVSGQATVRALYRQGGKQQVLDHGILRKPVLVKTVRRVEGKADTRG
ncbi:peptidylprolyl isomerase [soil metagenome]